MVKKSIITIAVVALLLGIVCTYIVYVRAGIKQKDFLISRTQTVSALITTDDVYNVEIVKEKLKNVVSANSDIRFAYILAKDARGIYFIADSEDIDSPDYSPYGQVYDEASDVLKQSFEQKIPTFEIATDRWGTWFSSLVPLTLQDESTVIVGLDIDAASYYRILYVYTSIPIAVTLAVLIMLATAYYIYRKEQETLKFKNNFISQASHDLRSPLSGIRWGAESLLKAKDIYTKEQQDTISMIYTSTIKTAAILKDLMQIAVIDSHIKKQVVKSDCNLLEVIQSSIKDLDLFAKEKNISISTDGVEKSIIVFAEMQDLKQVFANLISNAIKYSKSGAHIVITSTTYAKYNVIFIADQGIGIPANEQEKVLLGFYRSSNARKLTDDGTGLGLYSAKKVVELYGGTLTFKSEENKGSTFIVTLPKTNAK